MRVRVIDLDGSVAAQEPMRSLCEAGDAVLVPSRELAPSLRILATRRAMRRLLETVAAADENDARGKVARGKVTFYGSGDFHHLTAGLLSRVDVPVTVIHFDNHPDWVSFPPTFNCGAWVNRALELANVVRVITIGPCSDDLVRPEFKSANLRAVCEGRIEIYPWRHAPSRVWGRYAVGASGRQDGNRIFWRNLANESWIDFLDELTARIPTPAVWITIDKDVLRPGDAVTNWDQGEMSLDHLLGAIAKIGSHRKIVGADVCGDYSPPVFADPFRRMLAHFDHPKAPTAPPGVSVNASTNAVLSSALAEAIAC
jgi:arginase family enzyme